MYIYCNISRANDEKGDENLRNPNGIYSADLSALCCEYIAASDAIDISSCVSSTYANNKHRTFLPT